MGPNIRGRDRFFYDLQREDRHVRFRPVASSPVGIKIEVLKPPGCSQCARVGLFVDRLALTCLGVFSGRPDARAVETILAAAFPGGAPPQAVIHTLCTKSLVTPMPGVPPRFRLPGPVGALVREQFLALPTKTIDALEASHSQYFIVEVGKHLPTDPFTLAEDLPATAREEVDDLEAALTRLAQSDRAAPDLLGRALQVVVTLLSVSGQRIGLRDCVSLTERLLEHPNAEATSAGPGRLPWSSWPGARCDLGTTSRPELPPVVPSLPDHARPSRRLNMLRIRLGIHLTCSSTHLGR